MVKYTLLCLCCVAITIAIIFLTNISFSEKYIPAIFGFLGVLIGAFINILGNFIQEWYRNKDKKSLEEKRKKLLKKMLSNAKFGWRDIDTLSNVIGATQDETKRLLIDIGARASETRKNGKELWALIEKQPLP